MKVMILDTSSDYLYLYINNGSDEYQTILEGKNNHSEKLMGLIEEGFGKLKLEVKDLDRIICGIGPGSYTGLRVGLTVCKIFAWTFKIPLYTISSLDILGSGYLKEDGKYAITNIAKKNYVYGKIVEVKDKEVRFVSNDEFSLKEEFLNKVTTDMTLVNEENFKFDSEVIIKLAKDKVEDIHSVVPNYLRKANS